MPKRTLNKINCNVADIVVEIFIKQGLDRVFLYPGGTIAPLVNACIDKGIKIENFKNEQGAGYAALAYSKISNLPQVIMVTSGPGITNLITVIADAYYDSIPLIIISGQISTIELNQRKAIRQRGFQEAPTLAMTKKISKKAIMLDSEKNISSNLFDAFHTSNSGRKGPVVLDFPMNIQRSEEIKSLANYPAYKIKKINYKKNYSLIKIVTELKKAKKPVILLGNGAHAIKNYSLLENLVKKIDAFVVTSFLGVGSYNTRDKSYIGYIGHVGHYAANIALAESDFLIVLGSRLDIRQTGSEVNEFVKNGKILLIDFDENELDNTRVKPDWKIHDDINNFLKKIDILLQNYQNTKDKKWGKNILKHKRLRLDDQQIPKNNNIHPRVFLDEFEAQTKAIDTIVVTGVGLHQHWTARHLSYKPKKKIFVSSSGHGAMGFDLPSSIGASILHPEKLIICIVGDGSILMNIQELASIKERGLNLKIIVLNNSRLGIVSQFQKITFANDPSTGDLKKLNFKNISSGFGIDSKQLIEKKDIQRKIKWLLSKSGPQLLDVTIDHDANLIPMLLAGRTMDDMWMGYED